MIDIMSCSILFIQEIGWKSCANAAFEKNQTNWRISNSNSSAVEADGKSELKCCPWFHIPALFACTTVKNLFTSEFSHFWISKVEFLLKRIFSTKGWEVLNIVSRRIWTCPQKSSRLLKCEQLGFDVWMRWLPKKVSKSLFLNATGS